MKPEPTGREGGERVGRLYIGPLLGLFVGAAGAWSLHHVPAVVAPLARAAGPFAAPLITGDNLALAGGLTGLLAATAVTWVRARKASGEEP